MDKIRYVGKSINPKQRLKNHINYETKANTHKARWLNQLLSKKLMPELIIIEKTTEELWQDRERYWIKKLKPFLTNETEGGDGREFGFKHKPESIKKIVNALKNRSPELRKMIGQKNSIKQKGKRQSLEARQKNSVSHKVYWESLSLEEKQEKTKYLNRNWTTELRQKLSKTNTGKKLKKSTSKYRGVSWFKRDSCWRAWMYDSRKKQQLHLGYFHNEIDAAKAYDKKALEINGEFAHLNFPEDNGTI